MIDFRYHLVSTVAIFLALTVGIVLGTTMLQDPLLHTLKAETSQLREQSERLRTDKDRADRLNAGNAELVAAYAEAMLDRRLTGVRVVVVEPPGVDAASREEIAELVRGAGGTVTGRLVLTDSYLDPGESDAVEEIADRWSEEGDEAEGNPYERAGAGIARAVLAGGEDTEGARRGDGFDPRALIDEYVEAGLLAVHGEPASGADTALLLAPAEPFALSDGREDSDATPPANAMVLALARALERAGGGTVLAGAPNADGPTGVIRQARAEEARFTTVDTAGTPAGDVVTVLALALADEGRNGHYGIGAGVEGFLPASLPTPRPDPTPEPSVGGVSTDDVSSTGNES
ncbi:copper transporter [Thermobifida halotolerans]|uniref:Copper transporter n=1 Tax=Thermobifida halotolerans TaxID=483545 RepID=A0A399G4G9_9ACTN|nr:copper transporter [Thermobifida halotolerans]UOE17725.1 copper transporter [Thermobifida halotolerans]